eukprot:146279-Heterocapsa_arctica.AAC.1
MATPPPSQDARLEDTNVDDLVLGSEALSLSLGKPASSTKASEPSEASALGQPTGKQQTCTSCKLCKLEQHMANKNPKHRVVVA